MSGPFRVVDGRVPVLMGRLRAAAGGQWSVGWRRRGGRSLCFVTLGGRTHLGPTLSAALARALAAQPPPPAVRDRW